MIFVGGQGQAGGDLFAVLASGGEVVPLTYSNVGEMGPALSPDGGSVAFLRGGSLSDSTPGSVWVMNLLSGGERKVSLPQDAGAPTRVGWAKDGRSLVVAAGSGLYRAPAPPAAGDAEAIPPAARVEAESSLAVLLGMPVFGRTVACENPSALCVLGDSGAPALLAKGAHDAARWGGDSVAYFIGDALRVRPLGPGRERRVRLKGGPARPREPTVFAGPRR